MLLIVAYNKAMKSETAEKILSLNYQFYQSFAEDFSETRQRLQPGVLNLIPRFQPEIRILDLGCGNGELAAELARQNFSGSYLGTDFSSKLLDKAAQKLPADFPAKFIQVDLAAPSWKGILPGPPYDLVLCFAALHHIPGHSVRLAVCRKVRECLSERGLFYHSNWQFLKSERLKKRILPWEEAGLSTNEVDQGDYLLDWRRGGVGTRYVHHFTERELGQLAEESQFKVLESFFSDGKEGNLSIYQIWEPV